MPHPAQRTDATPAIEGHVHGSRFRLLLPRAMFAWETRLKDGLPILLGRGMMLGVVLGSMLIIRAAKIESKGAYLGPRAPDIELQKTCSIVSAFPLNLTLQFSERYSSIEVCIMKRGRETERRSEIRSAIEELSLTVKAKQPKSEVEEEKEEACHDSAQLKVDDVQIPTKAFLAVCKFVLQVLDKIGPTMAVLRQDINQNIQRLEALHDSQPELYSNLVEMLNKEKNDGNARRSDSCSRAFVWLTRALDFTMSILRKLADEPGKTMEGAVEESYIAALKPWHGWISSAAYKVALKMVPDRKSLMTLLVIKDDNFETLVCDFQSLILLLNPLLYDAHNIMETYGLSKFKSH